MGIGGKWYNTFLGIYGSNLVQGLSVAKLVADLLMLMTYITLAITKSVLLHA